MDFIADAKMRAEILRGAPIVRDIERWCLQYGQEDGIKPALAVLLFNTGATAEHYVELKAHVAAQADVGYWVYEMSPGVSSAELEAEIRHLNQNNKVHGILIQRPFPEHLDESYIMESISPMKNIEKYCEGWTSAIVADAFARLLAKYGKLDQAHRSTIHIAGFGVIITDEFISHMRREYPLVSATPCLPPASDRDSEKYGVGRSGGDPDSVLVTELHQGPGYITLNKVPLDVGVIIDLGFYVTEKGSIVGDIDHNVYEEAGLAIAPTPGGILPVLLWLMMERTIRAKKMLTKDKSIGICPCQ